MALASSRRCRDSAAMVTYETELYQSHTNHERRGKRRHRTTMKSHERRILAGRTAKLTVAMIATLLAFVTTRISESTAFVLVSPTTLSKLQTTSPTQQEEDSWSLSHPFRSARPSFVGFHRKRIRHERRPSILFAGNTSNDSNGKNKKKGNNRNNNTNNTTRKSNKGGGQPPKRSKSSGKPKNKKKKKPPVDPSKQKKQELMDQIKAKIKEEGEEKKRQQQNSKQRQKNARNGKPNQRQKPKSGSNSNKNNKTNKPNETTSSAQARLQTIADEDPNEILSEEDADTTQEGSETRKKLFMNPFEAGKSFRETLQNLSTLGRGLQLPKETKQKYFLDDRLLDGEREDALGGNPGAYFSSSPLLQSNFNSKSANSLLQEYAEAEALAAPIAYIPEVLVVGATGEIGRLVVRRLLLEGRGRFRVRVLVRDLYSETLNLLGTGVSYCQGDLNDVESLEYALTDVDKIVYVAGAPKPDETDFQRKFQLYLEENDLQLKNSSDDDDTSKNNDLNDKEWEQLASVLEVRSELAEQVDCIGMKNLVSAYQNVRHTDYGTSQAAKRSLFKFSKTSGDFDLFALDDGDDADAEDDDSAEEGGESEEYETRDGSYDEASYNDSDNGYNDEYNFDGGYNDEDNYEDVYGDYDEENYGVELESRSSKDTNVVKAQVRWLQNKFDNGVFVGRVPRADATNPAANPGGEASIISSKLQAREDPNQGIDMSGFVGFILRVVSDGNNYEAFVRTGLYETDGIEYVYEYSTDSKTPTPDNKSEKRFKTVRLAFENFKAVQRGKSSKPGEEDDQENDGEEYEDDDSTTVPPFDGSDVRYLGFRFRSVSNIPDEDADKVKERLDRFSRNKSEKDKDYQRFYMALSYIKVYRAQPEPEFIYLSDARIPPVIRDGMVHHQRKLLLTDPVGHSQQPQEGRGNTDISEGETVDAGTATATSTTTLFDEKDLQRKSMLERSPEETYFKYRGEEILVKSGLSYTIIRVAGFNEFSGSEASTIDLVPSNAETTIVPVSRAEVAQVCVSALLDPCALNKCVYMTKKSVAGKNVLDEEDISAKFEGIPTDIIL